MVLKGFCTINADVDKTNSVIFYAHGNLTLLKPGYINCPF